MAEGAPAVMAGSWRLGVPARLRGSAAWLVANRIGAGLLTLVIVSAVIFTDRKSVV